MFDVVEERYTAITRSYCNTVVTEELQDSAFDIFWHLFDGLMTLTRPASPLNDAEPHGLYSTFRTSAIITFLLKC